MRSPHSRIRRKSSGRISTSLHTGHLGVHARYHGGYHRRASGHGRARHASWPDSRCGHYFNPSGSMGTFATPAALASTPTAYDFESLMIHELGHTLGFSHSAVLAAMMYPFAPAPGTFSGTRPTPQQPGAPLGEDDRTGLRVLYPDPSDTLNAQLSNLCGAAGQYRLSFPGQPSHSNALPQSNHRRRLATVASLRGAHGEHQLHHPNASRSINRS